MQVVHTFVCLLHILAKVCLNRGEFLLGKLCHNWHIYNAEYHFGNQIWKQFYSHRKSSFFIHNLSFASKVSMIRDTEVFTNYFDHYPENCDFRSKRKNEALIFVTFHQGKVRLNFIMTTIT